MASSFWSIGDVQDALVVRWLLQRRFAAAYRSCTPWPEPAEGTLVPVDILVQLGEPARDELRGSATWSRR